MPKRIAIAKPASGIEREVKFSLDTEGAEQLRRDPLLSGMSPVSFRQISDYWDTPERDLRGAGISLRIRRLPDAIVQTVKKPADPKCGLISRVEDETVLDRAELQIDALRRNLPASIVDAVEGRLQPLFSVDVHRTSWTIERRAGTLRLDLDEGVIRAGGREQPIVELEIELLDGEPRSVFALAHKLVGRIPLTLAFCTKSDRGYSLLDGAECALRRHLPPVPDIATRADAFRQIAMAILRVFVLRAATFTRDSDPEAVHAMRVALRRLRTLVRFDTDLFPPREEKAMRRELRWLFDNLGAARNLDILIAAVADWPASSLPENAASQLDQERRAAYAALADALASRRYRRRLVEFLTLVECGRWAHRATAGQTARKGAAAALAREWDAIRGARRPSKLSPTKRHKLRIHTKRLRYAIDFYASIFAKDATHDRASKMQAAAVSLQDALGKLTDLSTIAAEVSLHFPGIDPDGLPTAHAADGEAALLDEADAAWRALRRLKPFWN